jgi:hypothetical protein
MTTELKLGKKPAEPRPTDFKLRSFMGVDQLLRPTGRFGFGRLYSDWGMLGNGPDDSVEPGFGGAGDCVLAGGDHETMLVNKIRHGVDVRFTGRNAIDDYSAVTGYVLGRDSTDQGTNVQDALGYRRNTGLVDADGRRHKILAYVSIDPSDFGLMIRCAATFGFVGIGFEVPESIWAEFDAGRPWTVHSGSPIEGGHYIPIVGSMDPATRATAITWGRRQELTKEFYEKYNDEAWVVVTDEMIRADGKGIHGFDLDQLKADLASL